MYEQTPESNLRTVRENKYGGKRRTGRTVIRRASKFSVDKIL